ncbi:hypothetical protein [Hymenobacter perfusus]|uniref:DUF2314 domain-containing protein n=1 Tax=Hymenobacter perfusus TaxID=1236770 RepID=A0A428KJ85_9BACT|nr:hypothetical protein [Hymenobacter perfusus]RSK46448.1 hypothetical protein EI293_04595 [Hymenobacter perfusus]
MLLVLSSFAGIAQQALPAQLVWLVTQVAQSSAGPLPVLPLREAQRTLGTARQRFQQGLPPDTRLYLTARVLNEAATPELVIVALETWQGRQLRGHILRAGAAQLVPVEFSEAAVQDWLLLHADGREEGNYLGKYWDLEEKLAARPE